jgi:hypothetical protein
MTTVDNDRVFIFGGVTYNWAVNKVFEFDVSFAVLGMRDFSEVFFSENVYRFKFHSDKYVIIFRLQLIPSRAAASTSAWTARATMPVSVDDHAVVAVDNSTVLLCGGTQNNVYYKNCYSYSVTEDRWTDAAALNQARTGLVLHAYAGNSL